MTYKRILIFLLLFSPFFASAAWAQMTFNADAKALIPLQTALARGVERNLNLKIARLDVPAAQKDVIIAEAAFDPVVDASLYAREKRLLTASVLYEDEYQRTRETGADAGIGKRFPWGMRGRLSAETARSENNSLADALDPHYRTLLLLNITQPLLKDFGTAVNTADIRIADNQVRQAVYGYISRAQEIGHRIEAAYLNLANGQAVLDLRIQSRELARELMEGNQRKLEQGIISVTEVNEAKTALMGRKEAVISARQQAEIASNRLKDLLEIDADDPLYDETLVTAPIPDTHSDYPSQMEALAQALKRRPDLKRLRISLENQDIRLKFLDNQKLPRLDLVTTLGLNGLSGEDRPVRLFGPPKTSGLEGEYEDSVSGMAEAEGYQWSVDLRFSYPIGNRAADARQAKGRMQAKQLIYSLSRLEKGIEFQVKNAGVKVMRSLERVGVAKQYERLAQKTLLQEMKRLRQGLSNTFRILDYQDDLISARIRRVAAVIDFNQGLAELYAAIGENLDRYDILLEVDSELIAAFR